MLDRLVERAAHIEIVLDFESTKTALAENPDFVEIAVKLLADKPQPTPRGRRAGREFQLVSRGRFG